MADMRRLASAWLCMCVLGTGTSVSAAETPAGIPSITVSGHRPAHAGPQRGLELNVDQLPGNVQVATGDEIRASGATSLTDFLNTHLQSVSVADYQGNPFQVDVNYRGFTASPQIGTPQGLAVFVDGVRVNEPFGDVVNWDLIPLNALSAVEVHPGSNPLFGRGALGGALALRTRNGFDDPGVDVNLLGGAWGRVHGQLAAGASHGPVAGFVAVTGFHEEGWRDNSPSDVRQMFGKLSLRSGRVELNVSGQLAGNNLVGNGLVPRELYDQDHSAIFTSPDETRNRLLQFTLDGRLEVTDRTNLTFDGYHRTSDRRNVNGDIYRAFDDMSNVWRGAEVGQTQIGNTLPVCRYADTNQDGIPDYGLDSNFDGVMDPGTLNTPLTDTNRFQRLDLSALNNPTNAPFGVCDLQLFTVGNFKPRNGKSETFAAQDGTGIVNGTPIATLNRTLIDQENRGGSVQFNFNGEQHHAMLGVSLDVESATYGSFSRLADIDTSHRVVPFSADTLDDPFNYNRFYASYRDIQNNAFEGTSTTSSVYLSETFSPTSRLHLSGALRYNYTFVRNDLKGILDAGLRDLHQINPFDPKLQFRDSFLCPRTNLASCPANPNAVASMYPVLRGDTVFDPGVDHATDLVGAKEKYEYQSLNPAVGVNFLPVETLNLYFNWSEGTRTPSVVELGCAVDPAEPGEVPTGGPVPVTIKPFRPCTLPSTLSGDPYLPQIEATTYEFGARGTLSNGWHWNASAYRTDLDHDIYFVGVTAERSFFDTIDHTRRQGLELGTSGSIGIIDFSFGYSLTEASFQSPFYIFGQRNSSADFDINSGVEAGKVYPLSLFLEADGSLVLSPDQAVSADRLTRYGLPTYHLARVDKGDRMPGVPLHNLNANFVFHLPHRWTVGLTAVGHSGSYVRGNENNDHHAGPAAVEADQLVGDVVFDPKTGEPTGVVFHSNGAFRAGQPFLRQGTLPGYFLFNLRAEFQATRAFTFFFQLNNVLDKGYFSGGRLDTNPFSPSIYGAIGPSGWNYNSKDWQNTTYVAPGAPRALWAGVNYRFGS